MVNMPVPAILLVVGGLCGLFLVAVVAVAFFVINSQKSRQKVSKKPQKKAAPNPACPECGVINDRKNKFCEQCGTALE
jgi:hypothetical protein